MAAKIGILGEGISTATGTATLYTVPPDKATRCRIMFLCENDGDASIYQVRMGTPGSEHTFSENLGNNVDCGSVTDPRSSPDPDGSYQAFDSGAMQRSALFTLDATSGSNNWVGIPYPADFYLSTGDTVDIIITTGTVDDHLSQVGGIEDDA